jgi:hypothetical protein
VKDGPRMAENSTQLPEPYCEPPPYLLNELAIVIGQCDLLHEGLPEYQHSKRIHAEHQILIVHNTH